MKIRQAIIPAAGFSTRFLPLTKKIPKELFPLLDRPCIQYVIDDAVAAGVEDFIIVVSNEKKCLEAYFKPHERLNELLLKRGDTQAYENLKNIENKARFHFIIQEEPLGLGHAVLCGQQLITDENFFVILPDDIIESESPVCKQMADIFDFNKTPLVSVMSVPWEDVHRYGIVSANPISEILGDIQSIIEKPVRTDAPSNLAVIGRYLLPRKIFDYLRETKPGADGEIQLTDALRGMIATTGLHAFTFKGTRHDTSTAVGLLAAAVSLALKHPDYKVPMTKLIKSLAAGI